MKIISILFILLITQNAHAAKYRWKFYDSDKRQTVADAEQKFVVGDWTCTIGAPETFKELPNKETRRIGCGAGDGLQAFTHVICQIDKVVQKPTGSGGFDLQMKKGPSSYVNLSCE